MQNNKFNQFKIGDTAKLEHTVTDADIKKFVDLTGDDNPLHVNKEYAKKTVFKDTVVHGMIGASFISTIVGKHIPGNGALWVSQQLDFLLPTRVGDHLTIHAKVVEKHESQKLLVLETHIFNQNKQVVTKGLGKVKCLEVEKISEAPESIEDPKIIAIVGGSRGIGAATAEYLTQKGYKVVVNYSKDKSGAEHVVSSIRKRGGEATEFQADVTDPNAVKKLINHTIEYFGGISGLVYCATKKITTTDFTAVEWEDMQTHMDIQLKGAFYCSQAVLKEFTKYKRGSVVFIGSLAADANPFLKMIGYATAKAALQTLAKTLALEYGPQGIRFNIVSPGMTETGLISEVPEKARLLAKMQTPLRKLAQPEDIAAAIEFLLSKSAQHITGETLRIYGGQLMI